MNQYFQDSLSLYSFGIDSLSVDSLSMDSLLMQPVDTFSTVTYQHFFTTHRVQDVDLPMVDKPEVIAESLWINIGLWTVLLAYLVLRGILNVSLSKTIHFLAHIPAINDTSFKNPTLFVYSVLFVPCFLFFVFFTHMVLNNIASSLGYVLPSLSWWQTAMALFLFAGGMLFVEFLFSILFNASHMFKEYLTDQLLIFNTTNVILLPFTLFYFYNDVNIFLYIGLAILAVFTLVRWWRGVLITRDKTFFSLFYIFVYLCSVKILPFLLLTKCILS